MILATSLLLGGGLLRAWAVSRETAWLRVAGDSSVNDVLRGAWFLAEIGSATLLLGVALVGWESLGITGLAISMFATAPLLFALDGIPRASTHSSATGRGGILRVVGRLLGAEKSPVGSRAELAGLLTGLSDPEAGEERQMIRRVFDFADVQVKDVMVPLVDVTALRDDFSIQQAIRVVRSAGHSRLPIFEGRMPNVIGMIHAFDLLVPGEARRVRELMKPATFIPDMVLANDVLRRLQEEGTSLSVVVDEYGGAVGIVTIEDLLEEVVGEIEDEYDRDTAEVEELPGGRFRVPARAEVKDLNERFAWDLPEGDYETIGGLLLNHFERVPACGETYPLPYVTLRVSRTRERSIEEVEVELQKEPE